MRLPRYVVITIFSVFGLTVLLPIALIFFPALAQTGLDIYKVVFLTSRQWLLIKNTLVIALGVTTFSLILGVPLAFLTETTNFWGRRIFNYVYLIPLLIPAYIHAIVWKHLLGQRGWLVPIIKIHSIPGAIFVLTMAYFPFISLLTISGLKSVNQHLEEASLIHHTPLKTLTSITLPLVAPQVFAGAVFVFIFSLVNFSVPDILRVNVYPVEIFIQFSAFFNEKTATLLSCPLIIISFLLIALQNKYMKGRSYISVRGNKDRGKRLNLQPITNTLCIVFYSIVFIFSILLPIIVLFGVAGPFSTYVKSFSTSKGQIGYSILLALVGALSAIILSFFIAYCIERGSGWKRSLIELAAMLPFAIPAIVFGIGMIKTWNHTWTNMIYGSSAVIIIGYTARFIPFGIWSVQSNLKQIPLHLEEAGMIHTAGWGRILRHIVTPLCKPGIMTGFFIIFMLSLGELATTLLIIPPGKSTLPIKIYNLMHYGADHMVAALSLMLIGLIIVFSLVFWGACRLTMASGKWTG